MHIKPGTWEANNAVCESDALCDPAVLVAPPQSEPHIRNRRLSPGSGSCGGGGGGCTAKVDKPLPSQTSNSPNREGSPHGTGRAQSSDREPRPQNRGRGFRREGPNQGARAVEKSLKSAQAQKERWIGETLSSLKPPPAFPVKDSPAKLQPAVSYASKVKAGGGSVGVAEEPPGIGALLQNQWGLSFITDGPAMEGEAQLTEDSPPAASHPVAGDAVLQKAQGPEPSSSLLLSCRHLVEAVQYHTQEWSAIVWKQKQDPPKVVWYKDSS